MFEGGGVVGGRVRRIGLAERHFFSAIFFVDIIGYR